MTSGNSRKKETNGKRNWKSLLKKREKKTDKKGEILSHVNEDVAGLKS